MDLLFVITYIFSHNFHIFRRGKRLKILITGPGGFIGKNLICHLKQLENIEILEFDRTKTLNDLKTFIGQADFIIHLAGVVRPKDESQFKKDNSILTNQIIEFLVDQNKSIPIIFTSSIQADKHNSYGISKKEAENLIANYAQKMQVPCFVYQLPNIFGKWCLPNYNSVVATWCHNISRGLDITISDPEINLTLVYIDDVVNSFLTVIQNVNNNSATVHYPIIDRKFNVKLKDLADMIYKFKNNTLLPNSSDTLTNFMHATYLSHLPIEAGATMLKTHSDKRGSFFEVFKSATNGQISVSTSKPGAVRGNHFHHTKCEKFVVIQGQAIIKLRKIDEKEVRVYEVNGANPTVVEILPGYTHNIENTGNEDMILLMWTNEVYNPKAPDTTPLEV